MFYIKFKGEFQMLKQKTSNSKLQTPNLFDEVVVPGEKIMDDLLQKGGVPAAPSGTATLLRLSPSHWFYPRPLLTVTDFRYPQLPWLDGRCVQGPGTYSPRHG